LRNTRTTLTIWGMRLVLAPYWVNYHLEQHLFVFTPCWKLPAAHRMLIAQGFGPRMELAHGYRQVLNKAIANRLDDPDHGKPADQRMKFFT
jgi:fatty acid desaturase